MVFPIDVAWLALHDEAALTPELSIVDAHHHLWESHGSYLLDALSQDTSAHRIVATIFCQSEDGYDTQGPAALRPVGETRRVAQLAEQAVISNPDCHVARGIVAYSDLTLGQAVGEVLDAHAAAAPGRFCGIRHVAARDEAFAARLPDQPPPRLLEQAGFRLGCRELQRRNLAFDAWVYHPQLADVLALARDMPELRIILNHVGGPLGAGPYRGQREQAYKDWKQSMRALASCRNVWVKLGGLGMPIGGFDFHKQKTPPSSMALAAAWQPYIEPVIDWFGPQRCMFESNFPVDKMSCSYTVLWNAFKRITADASAYETRLLFHDTALCAYGLEPKAAQDP